MRDKLPRRTKSNTVRITQDQQKNAGVKIVDTTAKKRYVSIKGHRLALKWVVAVGLCVPFIILLVIAGVTYSAPTAPMAMEAAYEGSNLVISIEGNQAYDYFIVVTLTGEGTVNERQQGWMAYSDIKALTFRLVSEAKYINAEEKQTISLPLNLTGSWDMRVNMFGAETLQEDVVFGK